MPLSNTDSSRSGDTIVHKLYESEQIMTDSQCDEPFVETNENAFSLD